MKYLKTLGTRAICVIACIASFCTITDSFAQTAPNLGTSGSFGAFSGAGAIGNTGLTVVEGDIGTHVGSFTGFPPGIYTGSKYVADATSLAAKNDLILAYNSLNDATHAIMYDTALGSSMGNGQVLTPRTYGRSDLTTIGGNLTFDAKGNPAAVFIVKIRAALNVAGNTQILLANGARAANIYWAVDGAVSMGSYTSFKGTILSNGAIGLASGSSLEGRGLAMVGAVTFSSNVVSKPAPPIVSDSLVILTPAAGDSIKGGTKNYQITWTGKGIAASKTLEYTLDSGATWKSIGTMNSSATTYNWNVPDTISKKARVRVTDQNNLTGMSGIFTIVASNKPASMIIVRPALGEMIEKGTQNYQITWSGSGIAAMKTLEYSLDSGATWLPIGTVTSSALTYGWNVPNVVSTKALVRVTDQNNLRGTSGIFSIVSSMPASSIIVVRPALGEIIDGGTMNYQITWTGTGIDSMKTIEYSLDSGATWNTIGTMAADSFAYSWNVPNVASTKALVRITDRNNLRGVSGAFTIVSTSAPGSIIVVRPALGEVIDGGTPNYRIEFTGSNIAQQKTFEYSLDGGANWVWIGVVNSSDEFYTWASVPNVATDQALVRIRDINGATGTSGMFTIRKSSGVGSIDALTVNGLDDKNSVGNNRALRINWEYTPDIGETVEVEYSLDGMMTWSHIANVRVADSTDTYWTTPISGNYYPVYVRVTSAKGMSRISAPFAISSVIASVDDASTAGYAVSNYPNPAGDQATIAFTLPVPGNVTLFVVDALGREVGIVADGRFNAGTHSVPFNSSRLAAGTYTYILQAGATRLSGRMTIVR